MFRPMRRKEKALPTEDAKKLLFSARRGVLAMNGDDGYPYAIPLNYRYAETENVIYFHSAGTGYKAELLAKNSKVCFTVYGNETVKAEVWAPYVQSVVVFGRCKRIEDRAQVLSLLRQLADKYYPDTAQIEQEIAVYGNTVQIYAIEIEHMSGKKIQEK